jgi:hypothetical protein
MSKAARSVHVFGMYLIVAGTGFVLVPNLVLSTLGMPTTTEVWIRVLGIVVTILGVYYVVAARSEATAYFRASVWLRAAFLVATLALVALGLAPAPIIGFGIVDLLGAVWTALSLRAAGFEVHERTAGVELPGSE